MESTPKPVELSQAMITIKVVKIFQPVFSRFSGEPYLGSAEDVDIQVILERIVMDLWTICGLWILGRLLFGRVSSDWVFMETLFYNLGDRALQSDSSQPKMSNIPRLKVVPSFSLMLSIDSSVSL
jgi:hypothetical protein